MQASGEPHKPEFTVICQLASIKRTGRFSTKKGAKQIAAQAMLDIVQNIPQNENQQQIATINAEPSEKTFRTYRELKKSDIKHVPIRLRNRHNFFLLLPEDDRREAEKIIMGKDGIHEYLTYKDKVDLTCKALKIEYEVKDIPNHPRHKMFILSGDFDCVIASEESTLYDKIIDYLKTMLNFQI